MSEETKNLTTSAEPAKEVAAKKTDKPQKKNKKPNIFARIGKWFHELKVEAKKVVWPSGKSVLKNTVVVLIVLVILCAVVTVLDLVFGGLRDLLAQLV